MSRQLFLDLDGVLADFDRAYINQFGAFDRYQKEQGPFWRNVASNPTFFLDLHPMPDALELWEGANRYARPTILTGLPDTMPQVPGHKREWVRKHFGGHVEVITCKSRDKCLYGKPGDVLVDDWPKYRDKWEKMGGIFVVHTSAAQSLEALSSLFDPCG